MNKIPCETSKLTGTELVEKVKQLEANGCNRLAIMQACGYSRSKEESSQPARVKSFYAALLEAKGILQPRAEENLDPEGRPYTIRFIFPVAAQVTVWRNEMPMDRQDLIDSISDQELMDQEFSYDIDKIRTGFDLSELEVEDPSGRILS
jgi:hypothetical protein